MRYSVYVLQSLSTRRYYAGHTQDVVKRVLQHNERRTVSTKSGVPWKIVYVVQYETRSEAMQHERQIKQRGIERYLRGVAQLG